MKYLVLLSALFLSTCSSDPVEEEITQPEEITFEYFMFLEDVCTSGDDTKYEITEEIYKSIINMHTVPECDVYHTVPDINGVEREGYLSGLKTTDPDYGELP